MESFNLSWTLLQPCVIMHRRLAVDIMFWHRTVCPRGRLIRQREGGTGTVGLASSTRRAPRRFEAQGRPGAKAALEKQRIFRRPASCGIRPMTTGGLRQAMIVSGERPPRVYRGAGPACPHRTEFKQINKIILHLYSKVPDSNAYMKRDNQVVAFLTSLVLLQKGVT